MPCPVRARKRSAGARTNGGASRGWTPGPASGCRSCPSWSAAADRRTAAATRSLPAARRTRPGEQFTAAGQTSAGPRPAGRGTRIWAEDPATGRRRDLTLEEDHAFWAWAVIEVLRATGIRVEELLELTHHSLVQYRLPDTGELVPLLQIAPSKTDAERLLVV